MLTTIIHDLRRIRNELNKTLAIGVYAKKHNKSLMESKKIVEEYLDS